MSDSKVTTLDDTAESGAENSGTAPATTQAAKNTAAKGKSAAAAAKEAGISDKRKSITIHQGEGDAGRTDVDVFVNGYAFRIKRGKPVDVPVEVVEVLKNAVTTRYEDGEAVEVPRFAFTVHN